MVHPLAILQWKAGAAEVADADFQWLRRYSKRNPDVAGYAVALNLTGVPFRLALTKFRGGEAGRPWVIESERSGR